MAASTKSTAKRSPLRAPVPKTFLRLNARFPLRAIRSAEEFAFAHEIVAELMVRDDLDDGEADYLDTLSDLVHKYEVATHPMPGAAEGDVLRVLMEGRGSSQPALAKAVGIAQSTISSVLTGKRALTREQVVTLAAHFDVSPMAFLHRPA